MPIDPFAEEILTFAQAAARIPRRRQNRPVHAHTVHRWSTIGVRGVRLETTLIGGTRVTSMEALRSFFAAVNHQDSIQRAEALHG
jgi:hypothetical protein